MQDSSCKLIVAAFTAVQVALIFLLGYTPYPDSNGYVLLAQQCLANGSPYPVTSLLSDYPFLWNVGAINSVALSLLATGSTVPLQLVYALMKGATAWLLFDLVRCLSGRRTAGIALLLYVAYPANYGEATSVLSEVPFIFFAMAATWMSVVRQWHAAAGVMLALGNWMRPFALVFIAAIIIFLKFRPRKCMPLLAGYLSVVLLIGTLSTMRTGLFLYQAKTGWMSLMQYSWDNSPASQQDTPDPMIIYNDTTLNVAQKDDRWKQMFLEWLPNHKADYVKQMPVKLAATYVSDNVNLCAFLDHKESRDYLYDELSMRTLKNQLPRLTPAQWLTLLNLFFYYLLLVGAVLSLRHFRRQTHLLSVAIIATGTLLLLLVGHGEARFHQPFMPFIIMLSAQYVAQVHERKH